MDDRQAQIKERAGLDESRLNQDFVEFLKKWGPHLMFGVAALALAYFGYQRWEQRVETQRDEAFQALEAALKSGSPQNLVGVASEHAGEGAVPLLARNAAADVHLSAYRTSIPADVTLDASGKMPEGKAFLTDEQRAAELKAAEELYQAVYNDASRKSDQVFIAVGALNGLASVAECRGEVDKAKGFYQQVQSLTKDRFPMLATAATKRIESLSSLASAPRLYTTTELPNASPAEPVVIPAGPMTGVSPTGQTAPVNVPGITGPDGKPIQLTPMNGPPPGFTGNAPGTPSTPTPTPAPAPAPTPPADAPKP
jgi:hypothetical protein